MTKKRKTSESIKQAYFLWLCDLVRVGRPGLNRKEFVWSLHQRQFIWSVPNDHNRDGDGRKLREQFAEETGEELWLSCSDPYLDEPASVFEVLVALSLRIEFILEDRMHGNRTAKWFWEMIENLGLAQFNDQDPFKRDKVLLNDNIIRTFLERQYSSNGSGNIFPIKSVTKDQRKVEIWYQMMEYLDENYDS